MRDYAVTVNGFRHVVQLADNDVARYPGAVPVETMESPAPANKAVAPRRRAAKKKNTDD